MRRLGTHLTLLGLGLILAAAIFQVCGIGDRILLLGLATPLYCLPAARMESRRFSEDSLAASLLILMSVCVLIGGGSCVSLIATSPG